MVTPDVAHRAYVSRILLTTYILLLTYPQHNWQFPTTTFLGSQRGVIAPIKDIIATANNCPNHMRILGTPENLVIRPKSQTTQRGWWGGGGGGGGGGGLERALRY